MGSFCYSKKNEDKEEFLIKQNKELIEQNEIIVSTSIDLIESINKLGEKISSIQINNNSPDTNLIINPSPNINNSNNDTINLIQNNNNNNNNDTINLIQNNINNEDNNDMINIVFNLEGKKQNVAINKNKQLLEAVKSLQKKEISCNDLNKIILIYNNRDITENVLQGEIISNFGINTTAEIKVYFR